MEEINEKKFRVWIIEDKNTMDFIDNFEDRFGTESMQFFCTLSYNESIKFAEFLNHYILKKNRSDFEIFIPDYVIIDLSLPESNDSEQEDFNELNKEYLTEDIFRNEYRLFTVDREIDVKPDFSEDDNEYRNAGICAYSLLKNLSNKKASNAAILSGHKGLVDSYTFLKVGGLIDDSFYKGGHFRKIDRESDNEDINTVFYKSFMNFREKELNHLDFSDFERYLHNCQSPDCLEELKEKKIYSKDGDYFFYAKNLFAYEFNNIKDFGELVKKINSLVPKQDLSLEFSKAYNNKIIRYFTHAASEADAAIEAITKTEEERRKIIQDVIKQFESLKKKLLEVNIPDLKHEVIKLDNLINTFNSNPPEFKFKEFPGIDEKKCKKLMGELNRYKLLAKELSDYINTGKSGITKSRVLRSLEFIRKQGILNPEIIEFGCPLYGVTLDTINGCITGRNQFATPGFRYETLADYLESICAPMAEFYKEIGKDVFILHSECVETNIFFNYFWVFRRGMNHMVERDRSNIGQATKHFLYFRSLDDEHVRNITKNYICFVSDGKPFDLRRVKDNDISEYFIKNQLGHFGDFYIFRYDHGNGWKGKSIFSNSPERITECKLIAKNILAQVQDSINEVVNTFVVAKAFILRFDSLGRGI